MRITNPLPFGTRVRLTTSTCHVGTIIYCDGWVYTVRFDYGTSYLTPSDFVVIE